MKKKVIISALFSSFSLLCPAQDLLINEIMQSNIDNYYTEHEYPDSWVEIYNPTSKDICISDYYLGQSSSIQNAYRFSTTAIVPSKGYLIVQCDKKAAQLHTDYKLESTNAGDLYLFNASGVQIDYISYPAMPAANIAYGRLSDGSSEWGWEIMPSPLAQNGGGTSTVLLPEPIFSKRAQVLSSSTTINIKLPSDNLPSDTKIYYTTDGSEPTKESQNGTSISININKSTVLRAKLISQKALCRRSTTNSYILPSHSIDLPIISICTEDANLYSIEKGILAEEKTVIPSEELYLYKKSDFAWSENIEMGQENFLFNWRRPINAELLNAEKEGLSFNQVSEIGAAGWGSRLFSQKSVKLVANKRFGTKRFVGTFWKEKQHVTKTKSFILRNGGQNSHLSRFNDAMIQKLFGEHVSNLDYQQYRPVVVYINGNYAGEFGLRERSNEDFVESNFNEYDEEDIDIATEKDYYSDKAECEAFKSFYNLYHKSGVTFNQISAMIDIDNFRQSLIAELFSTNTDYPHNNISMWKPKKSNGKWRWILKDIDHFGRGSWSAQVTFNMFKYLSKTATPSDKAEYNYANKDRSKESLLLYQKMFGFKQFTDTLIDCFSTYLGDFLKPRVAIALANQLKDEISKEIDPTYSLYNTEPNSTVYYEQSYHTYITSNFYNFVDTIKWYSEKRPLIIYKQMADFFKLGTVIKMTLHPNGTNATINGIGLTEGDFDGAYYSDRLLRLSAGTNNAKWAMTTFNKGKKVKELTFDKSEINLTLKDYVDCDSVSFSTLLEKTDFDTKLEELAISIDKCKNLSNLSTISLSEPEFAYVNISGTDQLPTSKNDNIHAYLDLYDNAGNYFRKKIILNKQGNNTTEKTNLSILFCEDEWVGEETPIITFGDWVPQDEFHLKAFYEDGMRGTAEIAYQLYSQITNRNNCYPKAFPISLYIDGNFYGVMAWQLKKHRDNYGLDKKNDKQVWLDGSINDKQLFQKTIGWDKFEIRNPKDLYYVDGSEYDGDNPKEIMGSNSPAYDASKAKMVRTANTKQRIIELSNYCSELKTLKDKGISSKDIRAAIEQRFDVEELINYKIFSLITNNYDGFSKNWQWFSLDGKQWTVAPYDCNLTFGYNEDGSELWSASQSSKKYDYEMQNCDSVGPMLWIKDYFWDDIKNRYKELRDNGTINAAAITALARNWYERIGEENYNEEWNRWPKSPCKSNFTDNPERFEEWIRYRIELEDNYLGYASETKSYALEMSSAEWATICVPFSFSVPDDIIAYTVKGVASDGCTLLLDPTTITEAYKPYLLCGPQGTYLLRGESFAASSSDPDYLKNGLLRGTLTDTYAPKGSYVFQKNNVYGVGFYAVNSDNRFLVPANHAYLSTENASNLGHFRLPDDSNSIQTISEEDNTDAPTFNYWGQQIEENACGFQIRRLPDGTFQKVIIK